MAFVLSGCGTISDEFKTISGEFKVGLADAINRIEMFDLGLAFSKRSVRPNRASGAATKTASEQKTLVKDVQRELARLGYYQGPRDGIIGGKTLGAVLLYQVENDITADGEVSQQLADHISSQPTSNGIRSLAQR